MRTVVVEARPNGNGFELWVDGEPVTQVRDLERAEAQLRNVYALRHPAGDHYSWKFLVRVRRPGAINDWLQARHTKAA